MLRPSVLAGRFRALLTPACVVIIIAIALVLRLYGLNWDQGYMFHPDERMILMVVEGRLSLPMPPNLSNLLDANVSTLNPHFFAYGSFPLYLLKVVSYFLSYVQKAFASSDLRLVGRAMSALFDTGTVLLVFVIARRIYGTKVGLLSSAFVALSVLNIQLSHFYTVDVVLTFFIVATFYYCLRITSKPSFSGSMMCGVFLGLGLATKVSIAPLAVTVLVAFAIQALKGSIVSSTLNTGIGRPFLGALVTILTAGAVFALTTPYAFLDSTNFLASIVEQSNMVRRVSDLPYTRQYVNTPVYWYEIDQIIRWGLGYPLGLIAWAGLVFTVAMVFVRRRVFEVLMLTWVVPYFVVTGSFHVKFLRYMLPIVPFLCIMGASSLFTIRAWAQETMRKRMEASDSPGTAWAYVRIPRTFDEVNYAVAKGPFSSGIRASVQETMGRLARTVEVLIRPRVIDVIIGVAVLFSLSYSVAYVNIYSVPHPAVQASAWMSENIPKGTTILQEHWEEGIPGSGNYSIGELPLYEDDNPNKLNTVMNQLQKADYIVFFSNRLYGTISRLPDRYPMTSRYYELLFSGNLGFELVKYSASYPNLAGISIVDDTFDRPGLPTPLPLQYDSPNRISLSNGFADESFTVYDHPKTMIFKKTSDFSANDVRSKLNEALQKRPVPSNVQREGLMLSKIDLVEDRAGGTWSEIFDRTGFANHLPLLTWLFLVELIGLICFPVGFFLFGGFVDRGYLLSKTLGILLVSYLAWLAASYHILAYSRLTIGLALLVIGCFSALFFNRQRKRMLLFLKNRWKVVAIGEAIFLGAFLLFYVIRLLNPDLWHPYRGGEKPMDLAYLNAVIRTTYFPPYDPWFSGGYLNYYYFGQLIVATLIKLSGITVEVAYNLAVPVLFALTVGGVFSLVSSLVAHCQEKENPGRLPLLLPVAIGLVGALMVAILGNLDGMLQIMEGLWRASTVTFESSMPGVAGLLNAVFGAWQVVFGHKALPMFDYWRSSRMMPPSNSITEFPFFTFLFADLHAHLISLPFTVLALCLVVQLVLMERVQGIGNSLLESGGLLGKMRTLAGRIVSLDILPVLVVFALVLGALRAINSWDYPTYLLMASSVVLLSEYLLVKRLNPALFVRFAVEIGIIYFLSAVMFAPFLNNYELFYSGLSPSQERTPFAQYVAVHGLFLFLTISFIAVEWARSFSRAGFMRIAVMCIRHAGRLDRVISLQRRMVRKPDRYWHISSYSLVALIVAFLIFLIPGFQTAALLALFLAAIPPLILKEIKTRKPGFAANAFVYLVIGLAVGLGIGVDLVTIQGDIDRMNTVFKFYLQAWVLFGVASAYSLWRVSEVLVSTWREKRTSPERASDPNTTVRALSRFKARLGLAWVVVLALLFVSTSIYPLLATPVRVNDRFAPSPPTINGSDYMDYSVYNETNGKVDLIWDYKGIQWLEDNVKGSPVILEAVTPLYRWGSRFSVYTGLPTVVGWDWHQRQQRAGYGWMVDVRLSDVRTMYTTPDPGVATSLLKKYDVEYVVVGKVERLYYPEAGVAKFERMIGSSLEIAYSNQDLTIYRVRT